MLAQDCLVRIRENCNILVVLPEGCYKSEGARGGVLGGSSTKSKINYDYGMVGGTIHLDL